MAHGAEHMPCRYEVLGLGSALTGSGLRGSTTIAKISNLTKSAPDYTEKKKKNNYILKKKKKEIQRQSSFHLFILLLVFLRNC